MRRIRKGLWKLLWVLLLFGNALLIIRDLELANPVDAECLRRRLRQPKVDKLIRLLSDEGLHEEQRMINSFIKH